MWPACSGYVFNGDVGLRVLGTAPRAEHGAGAPCEEQDQPCDALTEPWLAQLGTRPFPCRRSKRGAVAQRGLAGAPSAFPKRREIRDEPQGQREAYKLYMEATPFGNSSEDVKHPRQDPPTHPCVFFVLWLDLVPCSGTVCSTSAPPGMDNESRCGTGSGWCCPV